MSDYRGPARQCTKCRYYQERIYLPEGCDYAKGLHNKTISNNPEMYHGCVDFVKGDH